MIMKKYNPADFKGLESAMSHLKSRQDNSVLKEIKDALNKFFEDSECKKVIFTKNIDKLFFGMCVYAHVSPYMCGKILEDDDQVRIENYSVEIDSKLLEIGLTTRELVAILLHEVGHLVNDSTPANEIRKAIDVYMVETKDTLSLNKDKEYMALMRLAISDTIRKTTSLFYRQGQEIIADEFVFLCGYGNDLESAFKKIVKSTKNINQNVSNKLIVLKWTLDIYKDLGVYRALAIKTLNSSKQLTASELEKQEIEDTLKDLKSISVSSLRECREIYESIVVESNYIFESDYKDTLIGKIQRKGLKGMEEDIFEYQMRLNNVDTEDEAIHLMRQINSRMAVLDDYLYYSADELSTSQRDRWERTYHKYELLREELSKKTIYNRKNYGLWFDYNYLDTQR